MEPPPSPRFGASFSAIDAAAGGGSRWASQTSRGGSGGRAPLLACKTVPARSESDAANTLADAAVSSGREMTLGTTLASLWDASGSEWPCDWRSAGAPGEISSRSASRFVSSVSDVSKQYDCGPEILIAMIATPASTAVSSSSSTSGLVRTPLVCRSTSASAFFTIAITSDAENSESSATFFPGSFWDSCFFNSSPSAAASMGL